MGKHDPILKETFSIKGANHSVWFFPHQITWCPQKLGGEDMSEWICIKLHDVFIVEFGDPTDESSCCLLPTAKPTTYPKRNKHLVIYFSKRKQNSEERKCESVELTHENESVLETWYNSISAALNEFNRPKKLLIFVNPYGGKRLADEIFTKTVKPMLELCKLEWTLVSTQRQNHVAETLLSMSQDKLFEYDVVVAIGGDGTACEVVTGLLLRNAETSASNFDTELQASPIDMAVIPGGSSNALAFSVHGTDDPCTAAIHLVLGSAIPLDVGAIHTEKGIARFFVTQMSYGHLADTLMKSENLRWMGPRRYDFAGLCKFLQNKAYHGVIDLKLARDDSKKPPTECNGGTYCEDCTGGRDANKLKDHSDGDWKRIEGRFLGISAANISCKCALSPRGMAPFAHLSDGHLEVILVRKASRSNHLRYLLRTGGDSRRAFALPFIERYRAKELIFNPVKCCSDSNIESSEASFTCTCDGRERKKVHSVWNCDGEIHPSPSIRMKVHEDLIRIISRGYVDNSSMFPPSPNDSTRESPSGLITDVPI